MTPSPQNTIRRQLRQARCALKPSDQIRASLKMRQRIALCSWFRKAKHIAFYWPADGEISPLPLMRLALTQGKHCYLPVIQTHSKSMTFKRYQLKDSLRMNTYNIPEPKPKSTHIKTNALDLILLPLVGFDGLGNRLGMGGGYYDRALAGTIILGSNLRGPKRIGLAHELQKTPDLACNHWDIPMHAVVTASYFTYF